MRVSVANPAQTPTTPASPRKKLDILLGVLAGLVIGFALAILRDHADNSVSDVDELKDHWDQPVLAVVPSESGSKPYKGAARSAKALAGRSEALRHLRTSLNFIDVDHPPDSVVITSSVPGEGKSTIALTLAEVVAAAGQTVILVDGDLRRPSIASYAGIPQGNGLSDALLSSGLLSDVLMQHPGYPTLKILQAGSPVPNPSEILSSERMADLLRSLRSLADLVIVDAPPLGLVTDAAILSALTSGALVVVEPRAASRRALRDTLTQLSMVNARVFGLIVNKVRRAGGRYQYDGYAYSQAATGYRASPEPFSEETRIAHEEPPQSPERVS